MAWMIWFGAIGFLIAHWNVLGKLIDIIEQRGWRVLEQHVAGVHVLGEPTGIALGVIFGGFIEAYRLAMGIKPGRLEP